VEHSGYDLEDSMAHRHVARQRPRNKQLQNSRCYVMALQTTALAIQWLSSDHVDTLTDTNASIAQIQSNYVFCASRCYEQDESVKAAEFVSERVSWRSAAVQSL
jgi:hypothetical protein